MAKRKQPTLSVNIAVMIITFILFFLCALVAHAGKFPASEVSVFRAINGLPNWLYWPFFVVTQLGGPVMAAVFVVAAWLLGQRKLAIAGFLAGGIGYIMVEILKVVVDRPRPYALIVDAHQRTTDFLYNLGFPSGHTTNATVLSVICALMLRGKWRWLPFVWIPLVGVSRVYLGVHAPLDIVGGVALGLFITFGLYTVLSLLDKKLVIKP